MKSIEKLSNVFRKLKHVLTNNNNNNNKCLMKSCVYEYAAHFGGVLETVEDNTKPGALKIVY